MQTNAGQLIFEVSKPFKIKLPCKANSENCLECAKQFFTGEAEMYRGKIGCYIFSLRTGRGVMPYYVGKTKRSFEQEIFHLHKLSDHYLSVVERHKGTPMMTFVVCENRRGRKPDSIISDLEKYLIKWALERNPKLSNKKGLPKTRWIIKGVIGNGPGKPNKAARMFKELLGI